MERKSKAPAIDVPFFLKSDLTIYTRLVTSEGTIFIFVSAGNRFKGAVCDFYFYFFLNLLISPEKRDKVRLHIFVEFAQESCF